MDEGDPSDRAALVAFRARDSVRLEPMKRGLFALAAVLVLGLASHGMRARVLDRRLTAPAPRRV